MSGATGGAHTPGPWHVGMRPGPIVYGPLGEQVADCRGISRQDSEAGYNARLCAAGPDMLAALKELREYVLDGDGTDPVLTARLAAVKAAIAKAEGRA